MKNTLKFEELAMFLFSILLFNQTSFAWWWYLVLIMAPDIGMLGYLINTKAGAILYNFFHHKAIALCILFLGWHWHIEWVLLAGIILFGHASLDRVFGYGLKYTDSFQNTHLGQLNHAK